MSIRAPHFLLMSETGTGETPNDWRFVLASSDGQQKLVASDSEPEVSGERLELLTVVRALEALEQPSEVTLLTDSRYVSQGIAGGMQEWRENDWCWERFGELAPVKNRDLWQRVDRALNFHRVDCRTWRFDPPHAPAGPVAQPLDQEESEDKPPRRFVLRKPASRGQQSESEHSPRPNPTARPKRDGALAACKRWLEKAGDAVKELKPLPKRGLALSD